MIQILIKLLSLSILFSCIENSTQTTKMTVVKMMPDTKPFRRIEDIPLPEGYKRTTADPESFIYYLRNMGLKTDKTVYLYNGQPKANQSAQFAVLNISTGDKDLQQCADAVMRVKAEYHFEQKQYDQIIFYDNDKTAYQFSAPFTRTHFTKYLNLVFGMCGSASLSKQLHPVADFNSIQPGDVIIRGGFPGHAVMVMDVAANINGEKIYLLAQSYMPAQDMHILVNPENADFSPWYRVNGINIIITPEYSFTKKELKRW